MRLIVAGSRTVRDAALVERAIAASGWTPTVLIHGDSPGVDHLARDWASAHGIPVEAYPPDVGRDGNAAKRRRNGEMASAGEALVAVWDPASDDSTLDMVRQARAAGLPVYLVRTDGHV